MEILDRVVITKDFNMPGKKTVFEGTVGTIREVIGSTIIVQIDFIDGKQKITSIPIKLLRKATIEDLNNVPTCKTLTNPLFHPGERYITLDDRLFEINGVQLALNERDDLFQIKDSNGIQDNLVNRKFIDSASHAPFVEEITEVKNIVKEELNELSIEKEEIKIIIDNFEFNIMDNYIRLETIKKEKMEDYINAMIKLKKLLKGE